MSNYIFKGISRYAQAPTILFDCKEFIENHKYKIIADNKTYLGVCETIGTITFIELKDSRNKHAGGIRQYCIAVDDDGSKIFRTEVPFMPGVKVIIAEITDE